MKNKYQAWRGNYIDLYFGYLEKGEWVNVGFIKFYWLKLNGYLVRKIK
jgi:hypothetical protein